MTELTDLTLREASDRLAARETSAVELLDATLRQIEATEPHVHAYAYVARDQARAAAQAADAELARSDRRGPLHGIPVGVKDLLYTTDMPTEAGSKVLAGFVPNFDATAVRRLREAGAVIVGKTVTHEFAYGQDVPPTRNAWNQDCYPGGSSAGSGVSVAVRSAFCAVGSDTGASIRIPGSVNGVVGVKPTFGRVSRHGVVGMSPSLDHVGPLARTIEDAALLLGVIAGHDAADPTSLDVPDEDFTRELDEGVSGLRIGVDRNYYFSDLVRDDVRAATLEAIAELQRQGATIVDVHIEELQLMSDVGLILVLTDTSDYHRLLLRTQAKDYTPGVRLMLELGNLIPATSYLAAQRARGAMRVAVRDAFDEHRLDVLAAPTIPRPTMPLDQLSVKAGADDESVFAAFLHHNIPSNLTGQPALSVPCGFSAEDLPIGLQLIGRPLGEARLFRMAHAYERAMPFFERKPPVAG
jgi:aspartyl-tRNA(Asn)/glutamyl-tRNA(Gln) amidotransferase subunit A